jgi:hypothetical protein
LLFLEVFLKEWKVLEDGLSVDEFLHHHTDRGQHGQTSIGKFLGLHVGKVLRVGWLEAKWVKSKVACVSIIMIVVVMVVEMVIVVCKQTS